MKKIKNWFIFVVVIALLGGAVAVFSIGNDDDEPVKDNNTDNVVDTEKDQIKDKTFIHCCECTICYGDDMKDEFYFVDGDIDTDLAFEVSETEKLTEDDLYVGREVIFVFGGDTAYISSEGIDNEGTFLMAPECTRITLGENLYIWKH